MSSPLEGSACHRSAWGASMTIARYETIICPKCGHAQSTQIWNTVNVTVDPELKQLALNDGLNVFECDSCGWREALDRDLLYHDSDRRVMIWLMHTDESVPPLGPEISGLTGESGDSHLRLVRSRRQLLEKIRTFENGLDDRILEVVKLGLATRDGLSFKDLAYRRISKASGGLVQIVFWSSSGEQKVVGWRDWYEAVSAELGDAIPPENGWMVVDEDYAWAMADAIGDRSRERGNRRLRASEPSPLEVPEEHGQLLDDLASMGMAKRVYRILVKDPAVVGVRERYMALTDEQATKFADDTGTACAVVVYTKGEPQWFLLAKQLWDRIPDR